MKILVIFILLILALPIVLASPSYHLPGDFKIIANESGIFETQEAIVDTSLIQFYNDQMLANAYLKKLKLTYNCSSNSTYYKEISLDENDNLSVIISPNPENIKWGYTLNLNGIYQDKPYKKLKLTSMCSPDVNTTRIWRVKNQNDYPIEYYWDIYNTNQSGTLIAVPGNSYFSTTKEGTNTARIFVNGTMEDVRAGNDNSCQGAVYLKCDDYFVWGTDYSIAYRLVINSTSAITKTAERVFLITPFYFDYSDLILSNYTIIDRSNGIITLDIYKNWSLFNLTENSLINIDPYIGESTPNSPPSPGGGGGGYPIHQAGPSPAPPENTERNWMSCKDWEYWDTIEEKCFVRPPPPENTPWWILLVLLGIIYRKRIYEWLR